MASIKVGDVLTSNEGSDYTVISQINGYTFVIRFNDSHWYIRSASRSNIKAGTIKNPYRVNTYGVGFLGAGRFTARDSADGSKMSYEYRTWRNMLRRVYAPDTKRDKVTYAGCSVHSDWLNFQNFAMWLSSNKVDKTGFHLDKDLLLRGNKEYSPDKCSLVPQQINKIFNNTSNNNGQHLVGVRKNEGGNNYSSVITKYAYQACIGNFKTEQEAHHAYVVAKEAYVKEVANKWRGRIDERVYEALMNWTVNP